MVARKGIFRATICFANCNSSRCHELREEAKRKLGAKFDLRAFHDEVVGYGPLPLDVLDKQVEG